MHGAPLDIMPPFLFPFPISSLGYLAAPHAHSAATSSNTPKPAPPRSTAPSHSAYPSILGIHCRHTLPPLLLLLSPGVFHPPLRVTDAPPPAPPLLLLLVAAKDSVDSMPPPTLPVLMRTVGNGAQRRRRMQVRKYAGVAKAKRGEMTPAPLDREEACRSEDARRGDADRGKGGRTCVGGETNERVSFPDEIRFEEDERRVSVEAGRARARMEVGVGVKG
ncbi:hypothetical protein R3P38DRAFT_765754 [Favolaschia claudopus]|uniref:Uncharacterized protein n=1 Tax=Favolaschia claudopus TaxID=2862362 RepID=A0AAV9Z319_9AGAR